MVPLDMGVDISFATWLSKTNYPSCKKCGLTRLYNERVARGEGDFVRYNNFCKCFVKDESYIDYKYPRGIYARKDDFKIRVGPIFKCIEEELFKLKYFIKKIPVADRARYIFDIFGDSPVCVGSDADYIRRYIATDYSAFESSFTREVMEDCEMILYEHMVQFLPEGKAFMKLLRSVLASENECKFRQIINVKLMAGRMSGEMNTSLGNSFANLMLFEFAMEEFGCTKAICLVEGDDAIAAYVGPVIPVAFYAQLGFTIKLVYHKTLNVASFCGQVFDFKSLTVIADPIKIILNLAWANITYARSSDKKLQSILRTKALSLIYQYPGSPIIQEVGLCYLRLTEGNSFCIEQTQDCWLKNRLRYARDKFKLDAKLPNRPIAFSSRLLMEEIYHVTIVQQLLLEKYFAGLKRIEPIWHPVLYCHIPRVAFHYDHNYTSDRFGDHVIPYRGYGAKSSFISKLVDVIESKKK